MSGAFFFMDKCDRFFVNNYYVYTYKREILSLIDSSLFLGNT